MNEIKINGTQKFMGIDIPIIEGGFGNSCRIVSAKSVSEIHKIQMKEINQSINRLIKRVDLLKILIILICFQMNSSR